jgi:hypothetical protein
MHNEAEYGCSAPRAKETGVPFFLLLTFLMSSSFATVTVEKVDCPDQFEGKVEQVIDDLGPDTTYSQQSIVFKNEHTLKGSPKEQVLLSMLKHGPFQFQVGEEYRVQLRSGNVCWIEKL